LNWGINDLIPGLASNFVSVEWTGFLMPLHSEAYTFEAKFNDGLRLWVNDKLILDYLQDAASDLNGHTVRSDSISLTAGHFVPIKLRFYEAVDSAFVILQWESASQAKQVVPSSAFYYN
jgi:hypothetical protein